MNLFCDCGSGALVFVDRARSAIVLAMVRRKLLLRIPIFFSYIAAMLCRDNCPDIHPLPQPICMLEFIVRRDRQPIFLALAVICDTVKNIFPHISSCVLP